MTTKLISKTDDNKPRCQVILESTGAQCCREATFNDVLCGLHKTYKPGDKVTSVTAIKKKIDKELKSQVYDLINQIPEFETDIEKIEAIKDRVKRYQDDSDLNNLDVPIAYLHDLRNRIESNDSLSEPAKIDLINDNIKTTYACLEKRSKIILQLKYSVTLDQFRIFVKKIMDAINYIVTDDEMRKKIKLEIIESYRSTLPMDEGDSK